MAAQNKGPIGLPTRMVIAALGGMGAATVCHPLDTLRVNLQVDTAGRYTGMADAAVKITKRSGVSKGLYAGLTAAYLRQWTYGACRVGIYSFLLDKFKRDQGPDGKAPSIPQRMGMGMISGGIGSFVGTPSELALVRMTADGRQPKELQRGYKNIVHCLQTIAKEEGVSGWWKGATPTVIRAMLLTSTLLPTYSEVKVQLNKAAPETFPLTGLSTMFVGTTVASAFANFVINPLDVVKSRIQNMPSTNPPMYTGMGDCFTKSIKAEGPMVLLRGYIPAFIKLAPYTCISLILVEKITFVATGQAAL